MKKEIIKIRSAILVFLTHEIALPILKLMRKAPPFTCKREQLMNLPEGSLGHDLHLFLEKRNLPLLAHYARHDIKHVLLEFDTTDEGEACLQCFMLGNRRVSFPVLATVLFAIITMPEHWKKMRLAFREGRISNSFHGWNWDEMIVFQSDNLRNKIFNN